MPDSKTDLLSLPPEDVETVLAKHFETRGQPSYRVDQVKKWVFEECVPTIAGMTNLPVAEREALEADFSLVEPTADAVSRSSDGTVKHLWRLLDGELVESVLIPATDRLTLCISSQAGCAMGCTFCATGWAGFQRQLTAGEIVAQYRLSRRWALDNGYGRISNIVYMGMGEPLSNRKALHPSLTILNQGYGVGARRITVSTVGVVPGILELAEREEQFRLAVSLHAPESELRSELIPLEKRHSLGELMAALATFDRAGGRRITFEYTMIRGVNDAPHLAPELADLAVSRRRFRQPDSLQSHPLPGLDGQPGGTHRGVSLGTRCPRGLGGRSCSTRTGHRCGVRPASGGTEWDLVWCRTQGRTGEDSKPPGEVLSPQRMREKTRPSRTSRSHGNGLNEPLL